MQLKNERAQVSPWAPPLVDFDLHDLPSESAGLQAEEQGVALYDYCAFIYWLHKWNVYVCSYSFPFFFLFSTSQRGRCRAVHDRLLIWPKVLNLFTARPQESGQDISLCFIISWDSRRHRRQALVGFDPKKAEVHAHSNSPHRTTVTS